jgi:hypothetical protein
VLYLRTCTDSFQENGEIDILEGVNEQINNAMTLHTAPGCEIGSDITQFSGELSTSNCDINASGQGKNVGCSIEHPSTQSYGAGLNANGGGVYATQWTSDAISVYFFPRGSIPKDVLGDSPNPSGWGKPSAKFTGGCNIDKMFNQQQIIIDTTFCGQWAGSKNVWNAGTCGKKAATCEEWVRDNPAVFTEAYWEINGMKVYQDNGKAPVAPPASAVPSKSAGLSVSAPAASKSSIVPPKPSGVVPPIPSSKVIPVVPSGTTKVPVAPVSTSKVAAPGVPTGSIKTPPAPIPTSKAAAPVPPPAGPQSSGSRVVARPSGTATSQIAAPSGAGGMEQGWQWPSGDGEEPQAPASNATQPALPAKSNTQKPTGAASSVVKPSGVPAASKSAVAAPAPAPSANAPPVVPFVPKGTHVVKAPVHTVYETVYKTVIARAVATPAPFARDVRMARHFKEHRRKQAVRA